MSKYLDYSGLSTLWNRIKSYVASSISSKVDKITSTDNAVPKFDGTAGAILNSSVTINDSNHITAVKFIKSGGTSSLFLKADGSVDSNTYLTSFTETDPVFTASAAHGITSTDITNWNNKQDALEYYKEDSAASTMLGNLYFHSGGVKQSGDGTSQDNWIAMYGIANTGSTASTPVVGSRMASASGLFSVGAGGSAEMSASNIFDYINSFNIYTDSARLSQLNGAITISNAEQYYPDGNTSLTPVVNTSNIYLNTNGHLLYNNKEVATTDLIVLADWDESDSDDAAYIKNKPYIPKVAEDVAALPDYSKMYLTFEAITSGVITLKATLSSSTKTLYFSIDDGRSWLEISTNTTGYSWNVIPQDKILFKGNNSSYDSNNFGGDALFKVYGNIMSLVHGDNFIGKTSGLGSAPFRSLFRASLVTDAQNLILPATTLVYRTYRTMFENCLLLVSGPKELPATTLSEQCYQSMFNGCTLLKNASKILANTIPSGATSCCMNMFKGCSSLEEAPELFVNNIAAQNACMRMFQNCSSLKYIKCLATSIAYSTGTEAWTDAVASNGIFIKADNATWTTGTSGIPTGWTVYTESEYKEAKKYEIPTSLSQLSDDATHRLVTDTEKTTWNGKSKIKTLSLSKNQQDEFELENISSFSDFVNIIQNNDEVILDYNDSGAHMYFDKVLLWDNVYIFTSPICFGGNGILTAVSLSEGDNDSITIVDVSIIIPSDIPSDSDVVHIANEETITGAKTFSDAVRLNGVASSVDSGSRLLFTSNGVLKGCVSANTSGGLNLQNGSGDALYLISNALYNRLRAGTVLGTVGRPFGTLHTNGTINKYIDGSSEYTLTLPSQTGTLALENNTVAKIGSYYATTTSGYLKIKLNEPVTTMSSIYINLYSSYEHYEYIISGYNYGTTKMWHLPKVTLRSSNKSPRIIYLGYDGDNDLWVAVPHGGNSNVVVSEAANSYLTKTPIKDVTFTWGLSTDTSQWTGTIQKEVTVYPLADLGDLQEIVGNINAVLLLVNFGNDESNSE